MKTLLFLLLPLFLMGQEVKPVFHFYVPDENVFYVAHFVYFEDDNNIILDWLEQRDGWMTNYPGGGMHIELESSDGQLISEFHQRSPIITFNRFATDEEDEYFNDQGIPFNIQIPSDCDIIIIRFSGLYFRFDIGIYK